MATTTIVVGVERWVVSNEPRRTLIGPDVNVTVTSFVIMVDDSDSTVFTRYLWFHSGSKFKDLEEKSGVERES